MALTHTVARAVTVGTEAAASYSETVSGTKTQSQDAAVSNSSTLQVPVTLTVASLLSIFIVSDQAVTLKTNSSSAPDNTIVLAANTPLVWTSTCYHANLLTVNVTSIYVVNASGATANVKFRFLS